jgi:hypothetical protein
LLLAIATWAFSGCGSSKSTPKTVTGTLITLIGDAPVCDVLAFRPSFTKLALTPQGGAEISVFLPSASVSPAIKVNLTDLRDASTVLNVSSSVPAGTYATTLLVIGTTELVVYDATQSPPIRTIPVGFTNIGARATISPPLTISQSQVAVLSLDFDLLQSLGVDAAGQVTGSVNPILRATTLTASGTQGFGELDDLKGFVQRVDTVGSTSSFIGGLQVQFLEGSPSAPSILVNLTSATQIHGASALNQLPTNSFVEVNGFFDKNGNFLANSVQVEEREDADSHRLAYIGRVLSVTKDSSGNVTQLNLYIQEEEPNPDSLVPDDSVVTVNLSSSTLFHISSPSTNFANLPFGAASIVPGQELIVHGTASIASQPALTTVPADQIYLKLQAVQGGFGSIVQAGSDDKTGAFNLTPCATLLQRVPVMIMTNSQTAFVNVGGLSELTPQATLLVKGLPFFEAAGQTINEVTLTTNTLVVLANEVHRLS